MSKRVYLVERLRDLADHIASPDALSDEDCQTFADDVMNLIQKVSVVSLRRQSRVRSEARLSSPMPPAAIEDGDAANKRPPPSK